MADKGSTGLTGEFDEDQPSPAELKLDVLIALELGTGSPAAEVLWKKVRWAMPADVKVRQQVKRKAGATRERGQARRLMISGGGHARPSEFLRWKAGNGIWCPVQNEAILRIDIGKESEVMSTVSRKRTATPETRRRRKAGHSPFKTRMYERKAAKMGSASEHARVVTYNVSWKHGVDACVKHVASATPMEIVAIERAGVPGSFIKDLSKRMKIPSSRIFRILGVPKATAEKKAATGAMVGGRGGQAAIGMVKLLGIVQSIVANSTASEARDFDAAKWLGMWIERPQPALGGRKPADFLDTPTGVEVVARLLGSVESGAYQ